MDIAEIEELAQVHASPAVSILCPLERRRPGNPEDPRRLGALRARAVRALQERGQADLVDRLDEAIATVDLAHPADGIAIFVTADAQHVLPLSVPVRARVVINDVFATRDLLNAAQQAVRARVLVLAAERARCFQAVGHDVTEIVRCGFPLAISPPVQEDTPHRDLPIGERERAEAHLYVLREVEHALAELQRGDRQPLIVIAPERELAYFDQVTKFGSDIIARVRGNHVEDRVPAIEHVVAPVIEHARERQMAETIRRANESIGTGAARGVDEISKAAAAGRGHELFVEQDLTVRPATPDTLDDPIDDILDAVLAHGGHATIVAPESLAAYGGIVLSLRY